MSVSPTPRDRRSSSPRSRKIRRKAIAAPRRADPPRIYVALEGKEVWETGRFAEAHLRNKKGYVYLCWRDGDRVRNFYLGKAPRKSPTGRPAIGAARARRRSGPGTSAGDIV
jgi:hypothetical protein